jgi:peptidoglycan/LPS O-acetylase OafA/YrhL
MRRSAQIDSLQAGRALAALAVEISHASLAAVESAGSFLGAPFLERGYLGVDFFFVLSGFIIYHSSRGKRLAEYTVARVRRVYIPYVPVGVGIAVLYVVFPQISAGAREWSWLPTLTLLPVQSDTALFVAWTLKHEILFYAMFALLFFSGFLTAGLALWTIVIVGAHFAGVNNIPFALINLEFVFGILVAVFAANGRWTLALILLAPVPTIIWSVMGADRDLSVLVGLSFALLLLAVVNLERAGRVRVPSWLLFLGAASYSIYLVHTVAISLVVRFFAGQHWSLIFLVAAAAGVTSGVGYYLVIEQPLLNVWPRKRAPRPLNEFDEPRREPV